MSKTVPTPSIMPRTLSKVRPKQIMPNHHPIREKSILLPVKYSTSADRGGEGNISRQLRFVFSLKILIQHYNWDHIEQSPTTKNSTPVFFSTVPYTAMKLYYAVTRKKTSAASLTSGLGRRGRLTITPIAARPPVAGGRHIVTTNRRIGAKYCYQDHL